ncbi:hypothetical protein [Bacillus sp. KH172YL63]|uniref:hypothetical protein n=1 Tax=Bacillus sp. KH172YL63 TaxID=2709784 RepID=UPI0013E46ADB|nr:hypothetical protein [Bacillus sp. KH172YL63]BCB05793.1 hypothetical protein KH172YL63_39260 [Bacillus sp. KH172YL63]
MKNRENKNLQTMFPQLHLTEDAKTKIHSKILRHEPKETRKRNAWQEGKFISIASAVMALALFSVLTVYMISEAKRGEAEQLFAAAEEQINSLYSEMEGNLKSSNSAGLLKTIDHIELKSAQTSLNGAEEKMNKNNDQMKKKMNQQLMPKLNELEEYKKIVPLANEMQQKINEVKRNLNDDPLNETFDEKINDLNKKSDLITEQFNLLESDTLRAFFDDRYTSQLRKIEEDYQTYTELQADIEKLNEIAEGQSLSESSFEKEVAKLNKDIGNLNSNQAMEQLQIQIDASQTKYYETKEQIEVEKKKEEEEKNKEEKQSQEDEYPMEFTRTNSQGQTIRLSRDLMGNKKFLKYDEIAKKYGGRYYYTPKSDMSYIIKDMDVIATISLVSVSSLEYKDLFIDLMAIKTAYSKEEFSEIVEKVIETGKPYKIEKGKEGESLEVENGFLIYHIW